MKVTINNRDHTTGLEPLPLTFDVYSYRWAAMGGPKDAIINATGDDIALWHLITLLRNPIFISSKKGDNVWWGYIAAVEATLRNKFRPDNPSVRVGLSVDSMFNRIAVAYVKVDLTSGDEERDTTGWADDTDSQNEYGIKELLWSASSATQAHAEAARDMKLAQVKYPIPVIEPVYDFRESTAKITARGWWDTLGWQYYANAGTSSVDTATQIETICSDEGQFFNGITVRDTSGISIRETRDGDATALYEVMQMLEMGTTNFRRLLTTIDAGRHVQIYEEPAANTIPHLIYASGEIKDPQGNYLRKETCPVAFYARFTDIIPASVETAILGDPTLKFIEEAEYRPSEDKLYFIARGDPSPWEFPVVRDG